MRVFMGQELPTIPEHLSSPQDFNWMFVVKSLVLCLVFYKSLLVLCLLIIAGWLNELGRWI
jgi:hypothetical protein